MHQPLPGVVVGPFQAGGPDVHASVTLAPRLAGTVWLVMAAPSVVTADLAARLVAIMAIHRTVPLLYPTLHPRKSADPLLLVQRDGAIADRRGAFPSRLVREVARVARKLSTRNRRYIAQFAQALRGQRPSAWKPVPADFELLDPANVYSWAPPAPAVRCRGSELAHFTDPDALLRIVRYDYQHDRYLQAFSDEEILQRAEEALVNTHDYEDSTSLVIDVSDPRIVRALARLTEATEELCLRSGKPLDHWMQQLGPAWKLGLPQERAPVIEAVTRFTRGLSKVPTDGLARLGKAEHICDMLECGRFRLSPASSFTDPSLNRARQANELAVERHLDPSQFKIELVESARASAGPLDPLRATVTQESPTDFLVLCTSRRVSARSFFDFDDADACLIIRDRAEFLRRLNTAVHAKFAGWRFAADDIWYFDPFSRHAHRASIPFYKPVRYEYQQEHRVVVVPPQPVAQLQHAFIEIGALHDIATMFRCR